MAIFYDRICGAKGGDSNNPIYWTYLQFRSNNELPHIHLSKERITEPLNDGTDNDYGQILLCGTEKKKDLGQTIYSSIKFQEAPISLDNSSPINFGANKISYMGNLLKLSSGAGGVIQIGTNIKLEGGTISSTADHFGFGTKEGTTILALDKDSLKFLTNKLIVSSDGSLTVPSNAQISAGSFNATSDKRAKTNLVEIPFSYALSFINSTPVYTFTYKDSNKPSIGVLAQDLLKNTWFANNFSLVDNVNATGENGDYMSVKESKLVYVLWSAVQELSKQINTLQEEIKSLKN